MDPRKWQEVTRVFGAALEQPASRLACFLDDECGGDAEVRAEVKRLLFNHLNAGEFLEGSIPILRPPAASSHSDDSGFLNRPLIGPRFEIRVKVGSGGF